MLNKKQQNNDISANKSANLWEEFTVEYNKPSELGNMNKGEKMRILFRSKIFDFLKNNSIKYLLLKIKDFYAKFTETNFEKLNTSEKNYLGYLFNEKQIENIKLLDYDDYHPLRYIQPEQLSFIKSIHYRVDNSNKNFNFLEKAIKPANNISNGLQCLIIETNQFNKLKEYFNDFGKNFPNLIDIHIYLIDKSAVTFEEIIKHLTSKIIYMKNNKHKYLNENNEMAIPFRNITFRNFNNKAKIDAKILFDFFRRMSPKEFGVAKFTQIFETLNLTQSCIDDENSDLAKIINNFRMIKVFNISQIMYA